jgi:hypothetical protein
MAEQVGYVLNERQVDRIRHALRLIEGQGTAGYQRKRPLFQKDHNAVTFRNDYAGTIPAYGCVRITGVTSSDDVQVFTVSRPDTSFARLYLVNGPEDVAEDAFGWGTFLWHADWVLYDDANTPAFGESWGPQNGSFELAKWRYGFTIWGAPTGGTTDRVMASQDWVNHFYGQTDAAITKGSSGTISVYDGNNADTSINVSSVENKFANVAITKKVGVSWQGGVWRLTSAEC